MPETDQQTTVVVIDDHPVFAESLASALTAQGIAVIGTAHSGAEGIRLAALRQPDVVLADYRVGDVSGADLLRGLAEAAPQAAVVVLTASTDERTLLDAMDAGCIGFVTKDQRLDEVVAAVTAAGTGQAVISPSVLQRLLPMMRRGGTTRADALTKREREVLDLMAQGLSNQAMADSLYLSLNTVRNHVRNVLGKLSAHSKLEAVAIATRAGLVADPGDAH